MFEYYDDQPTQQTQTKPKPGKRQYFKVKGRGKAKSHESAPPEPKDNDPTTKPWQQRLRPWIELLFWLLLIVLIPICFWNIGPYEMAVRFVASKLESSALMDFLAWLPLLGAIIYGVGRVWLWLIGAFVWAVIQLIELMPMLMTNNPDYVRGMLNSYEVSPKFTIRQDDPGHVKSLKKFYNVLPLRFLIMARRMRGLVYVLDMIINLAVFPPVEEGGIGRFFFLLGTGQWGELDWGNIILAIVTIVAVETIVKITLIVNHFRRYLKAHKAQTATATA